jgi:hypothetical protein
MSVGTMRSSLGAFQLPVPLEKPLKPALSKSGTNFPYPKVVTEGSDLDVRMKVWVAAWEALPESLRAQTPPYEEIAEMESITEIRNLSTQKTWDNVRLNVRLQVEFLELIKEIEAITQEKRMNLLAARDAVSSQLAAILGDRTGLPQVNAPSINNIDMERNQVEKFTCLRCICIAKEGKWLSHAREQLFVFLQEVIS